MITLLVGLGVGGLGLMLSLRGVRWSAVVETLQGVRQGWLVVAGLSSAGVGVLKATRWYRLFVPDHKSLEWRSVLATLIVGQMVNVIVPVRGGGEALRIGLLTRRFPVSALRVSGTIIMEKLLDVGSLSMLALAVAPITAQSAGHPVLSKALLLVTGGGVVGLALTVRFRRVIRRWLGRWPGAARRADQLLKGFNVLRSADLAWEPAAWTVAVRGLSFVSLLAGLRSAGATVPLLGIVALDVLLNLSYLLPTPPGLIGLVQYVTVLVLGFFDIARAEALGAGVVLHLTILSPFLLFGLPAGATVLGFPVGPTRMGRQADKERS